LYFGLDKTGVRAAWVRADWPITDDPSTLRDGSRSADFHFTFQIHSVPSASPALNSEIGKPSRARLRAIRLALSAFFGSGLLAIQRRLLPRGKKAGPSPQGMSNYDHRVAVTVDFS
jgi:hypothetical protein